MSKTDELRVRVTPENKQRAKEVFEKCGMTTSAAINLFIQQSILVGGLPFQVVGNQTSADRDSKI